MLEKPIALGGSWPEVLDKVKEIRRVTWTLVSVNSTVLDYDGQRVLLGLSSGGLAATFNQGVHAEVVRQGLIEAIGLDARVEGTAAPGGGSGGAPTRSGGPGAPTTAQQLGVSGSPAAGRGGTTTPESRSPEARQTPGGIPAQHHTAAGAPPAREWAEAAREAPPAWATEPVEPATAQPATAEPEPAGRGEVEVDKAPVTKRQRPGDSGDHATAPRPADEPVRRPGGDIPRAEDEGPEGSGAVGPPGTEKVLGGTVIAVDDDPTH